MEERVGLSLGLGQEWLVRLSASCWDSQKQCGGVYRLIVD